MVPSKLENRHVHFRNFSELNVKFSFEFHFRNNIVHVYMLNSKMPQILEVVSHQNEEKAILVLLPEVLKTQNLPVSSCMISSGH